MVEAINIHDWIRSIYHIVMMPVAIAGAIVLIKGIMKSFLNDNEVAVISKMQQNNNVCSYCDYTGSEGLSFGGGTRIDSDFSDDNWKETIISLLKKEYIYEYGDFYRLTTKGKKYKSFEQLRREYEESF